MAKELPAAPSMEHFKKQAKALLTAHRNRDESVLDLIRGLHPEFATSSRDEISNRDFTLSDAQLVIARDYAFPSWPKLKRWVEDFSDPLRVSWVEAIKAEDLARVAQLLRMRPRFANSCHIEFEDPWRTKKFPTNTLDYVAAGPWPQTPECLAWNKSRQYNMDLIRLLLDKGALPDGETHHGPCLSWIQNATIAALLVERGARINQWNANGGSPLNYTCWGEDAARMRMLLKLGANPNLADPVTHETCLHEAAGHAFTDGVRLLLESGAEPNARCIANGSRDCHLVVKKLPGTPFSGETPLHRAAVNADADCIRALVDYGADRTLRTAGDETAYDWARRAGRTADLTELLRP